MLIAVNKHNTNKIAPVKRNMQCIKERDAPHHNRVKKNFRQPIVWVFQTIPYNLLHS